MKHIFLLQLIFFITIIDSRAQISLVTFATGVTNVVDITSCGDSRIFIVQKPGVILAFDSSGVQNPVPFLNIIGRVNSSGLERGLLSLVFAKDFLQSGIFYVYYVAQPGNDTRISRFRVSSNPEVADSTSEQIIITIPQPVGSHFGGDLAFGKDDYLYAGLGDGGGEGDPDNHAQDTALLLGKFLRLDVSDSSLAGYSVPNDNPFLNSPFPDEIWSVGFRNPWRWSFDRFTGDMWIGDVGQTAREEIDMQPAFSKGGENYGWRCYEGSLPYLTTNCAGASAYTNPVHEYPHGMGCSVTGGFVYRGSSYHTMFGKYFYGDWCTTTLRGLIKTGNTFTDSTFVTNLASGGVCFGEDRWGDLLLGVYNGTIYRIIDSTAHHVAWISDSDTMKFCASAPALLQTPVGYGFHYEWNFNGAAIGGDTSAITVTQPGNYFVTVQNAFGLPQVSDTVYVEFIPSPVVTISGLDTLFCFSDPAVPVIVNPIGGQLFIDGILQSSFQFSPSLLTPGFHLVDYRYTNTTGCSGSYNQIVRVDACNFIDEKSETENRLYPVPAGNYLRINMSGDIAFYDLRGALLNLKVTHYADHSIAETGCLSAGFYFCWIKSEKRTEVLKWIKN